MTKLMSAVLVIVVALLAVSKVEATETVEGWTGEDIYAGCFNACQANYDEICEPAVAAASHGKLPQEQVQPMCYCGVLVCTNVCTRESGAPSHARALPEACYTLGVTE